MARWQDRRREPGQLKLCRGISGFMLIVRVDLVNYKRTHEISHCQLACVPDGRRSGRCHHHGGMTPSRPASSRGRSALLPREERLAHKHIRYPGTPEPQFDCHGRTRWFDGEVYRIEELLLCGRGCNGKLRQDQSAGKDIQFAYIACITRDFAKCEFHTALILAGSERPVGAIDDEVRFVIGRHPRYAEILSMAPGIREASSERAMTNVPARESVSELLLLATTSFGKASRTARVATDPTNAASRQAVASLAPKLIVDVRSLRTLTAARIRSRQPCLNGSR